MAEIRAPGGVAVYFSAGSHGVPAGEPATAPLLTLHEELVAAGRGGHTIDVSPRGALVSTKQGECKVRVTYLSPNKYFPD